MFAIIYCLKKNIVLRNQYKFYANKLKILYGIMHH